MNKRIEDWLRLINAETEDDRQMKKSDRKRFTERNSFVTKHRL